MEIGRTLLGRYRVERALGAGGSATAFCAFDFVRHEPVALKIVHRGRALEAALERELDLLSRLSHPHLVAIYDAGRLGPEEGGRLFYAARWVDGPTLEARPGRQWRDFETVLLDALDALAFLHRAGIRHGDVSPRNILCDPRGRGVLIDLGCAGPLRSVAGDEVSGTLGCLAPELAQPGAPVDARADLYAFGRTAAATAARCADVPSAWTRAIERASAAALPDRAAEAAELFEIVGAPERARAPAPVESGELLGREDELARIERALDHLTAAPPRSPRAVAIVGRPGSGRTRVYREALRRLWRRPGLRTVVADARQRSPVGSWFEQAIGAPARSVEEMLERLDALRARGTPTVFAIDDADRLADPALVRALIAALREDDPIAVLAVGISAPVTIDLAPLSHASVAAWARGRIDDKDVDELVSRSGGHPGSVRRWLAELVRAGSWATAGEAPISPALAALAADEGTIDPRALGDDSAIADAVARGLARYEAGALRIVPDVAIEEDGPSARRAFEAISRHHEARGERTLAIVAAVRAQRSDLPALLGDAPDDLRIANALADHPDAARRLDAARMFERIGAPARALAVLDSLHEHPPLEVQRRRASALLKLDRPSEAIDALANAVDAASGDEAAWTHDVLARAHIRRGEYETAATHARRGLAATVADPRARAALLEALGVALSYLGDPNAEGKLREAEQMLVAHGGGPRDRVRIQSYLAIEAYRRGRLDDAGRDYERALAIAHEHRLDDQIAHAALNLGTVHQQRGHYGPALAAYLRAHRLATALDQRGALATLEFNLAQLHASIGAFDRAEAALERARKLAEEGGYALLSGGCEALAAEIALDRGRPADAAIERARGVFERLGAEREREELALTIARAALAAGDAERADEQLQTVGVDAAADVAIRRAILAGRLAASRGDAELAVKWLHDATNRARERGFGALEAAASAELARGWTSLGATTVAASHARAAREIGERTAAALPPELRDAFWAHPARAPLRSTGAVETSDRERQLERLLAINRKLSSSLEVADVLHQALDAAIELTGAERGFVVLRDPSGELAVPVARNLDRERVGRSHLKFSRSIAERAMATGEPVVTVDATSDERFAEEASVHAMKLRSVIAVPIPSPDGVVGALYLDNRFQRARFAPLHTDLLLAFADQVAIALANARLHEELAHRTEQLERERERVEALSRGQAIEIERLSVALADARQQTTRRYDYGALVARSAAMQPILATLEKVIESPLSILVEGESGTGKELVARAVHSNGARKNGPFVTINCAALPDALLESELFGHVRGAFTGADRDREGLMVAAQGGTLFLDEIGEMSLAMQAKLLRALQEREVRPVGGTRSLRVDFRLVCATNRDLRAQAAIHAFREDLYYRIGVVVLRLPPLRERLEDLPELAARILARTAEELGREPPVLSPEALRLLLSRPWPGNVRQLENALRAAVVIGGGDVLEPAHFALGSEPPVASRADRERRERARILEALEATHWNASAAAKRVGMSRATFYRKLAKHKIR